jgi:REP element-mobilizing transposase RayT
MSETYQRLAHSSWDCKYHVVFVPKRRRKVLFGQARRKLGEVLHALARQKVCQILEGHRDTCCRTMCTCASRFLQSIRWPR